MAKGADKVDETAEQKQAAQVAAKEWNRYQDVFVPLENEYKSRADRMNDDSNYQKIEGAANTTSNSATNDIVNGTEKQLQASGVNPNSGKSTAITNDIISNGNANESQTAAEGDHDVTKRYIGNQQNVMSIGQGQKATATAGLNDIASASGNAARQNAINKANRVSIPAAVVGVGASYLAGTKDGQKMMSGLGDKVKSYFNPEQKSNGLANKANK